MKNSLLVGVVCAMLCCLGGCNGNSGKEDMGDLFPAQVLMESGCFAYGYINIAGDFVIPPHFFEATDFDEGLACVRFDEWRYGFIDKNGKVVIDDLPDESVFSEGLARIWADELKWGFIDKTGKFVIEPRFDDAWNFSEGMARVKVGDKWGFIDKNGDVVIDIRFDGAGFVVAIKNVADAEVGQGEEVVAIGDKKFSSIGSDVGYFDVERTVDFAKFFQIRLVGQRCGGDGQLPVGVEICGVVPIGGETADDAVTVVDLIPKWGDIAVGVAC